MVSQKRSFNVTSTLKNTVLHLRPLHALRLALLWMGLVVLTGCATLPPPPVAPAQDMNQSAAPAMDPTAILDVEWRLVEIRPAGGSVLPVAEPEKYTLLFTADGSFSGQLDCNRMKGQYELDGDKLVFGPIATTMAFCPADDVIGPYTEALNSAASYALRDGKLIVAYGPGAGELVYEKK